MSCSPTSTSASEAGASDSMLIRSLISCVVRWGDNIRPVVQRPIIKRLIARRRWGRASTQGAAVACTRPSFRGLPIRLTRSTLIRLMLTRTGDDTGNQTSP